MTAPRTRQQPGDRVAQTGPRQLGSHPVPLPRLPVEVGEVDYVANT